MSFTTLPLEIWYKILEKTDPNTLLTARHVCSVWTTYVNRICFKRLKSHLHETVIDEIIDEITEETYYAKPLLDWNSNWHIVYGSYIQSQAISLCDRRLLFTSGKMKSFLVLGCFLLIWYRNDHGRSRIEIIDTAVLTRHSDACVQDNSVYLDNPFYMYECDMLYHEKPIFVLRTSRDLMFLKYNTLEKKTSSLASDLNIECDSVRCSGRRVMTSNMAESVLECTMLFQIEIEHFPHKWSWKNNMITTIENSGHVRCYLMLETEKERNMVARKIRETDFLLDIRYPNPSYLSPNIVFTSNIAAEGLLGLWHINRGLCFWLMCSVVPGQCQLVDKKYEVPQGFELKSIELVRTTFDALPNEVVLTVRMRRGRVFCATNQGKVKVYQARSANEEEGSYMNNLKEPPSLVLDLQITD